MLSVNTVERTGVAERLMERGGGARGDLISTVTPGCTTTLLLSVESGPERILTLRRSFGVFQGSLVSGAH